MPGFMKAVANLVLVIAGLATAIGVYALFTDGASHTELNSSVVGGGLVLILLSGGVWLLSDIATMMERQGRSDD